MRRESYPDPQQILEHLAQAASELVDAAWEPIPIGAPYPQCARQVAASISLLDLIDATVTRMAANNEVFTSDYRHEATPLHSVVYRLLAGMTVQMNCDIAAKREVPA